VASCVDNSGVGTRTCTWSRISQLRVFPMYDKITFGIVTSGKSFLSKLDAWKSSREGSGRDSSETYSFLTVNSRFCIKSSWKMSGKFVEKDWA
jgi:hypothetical protein